MKKLFTILSFVLLLAISCTRFDDSAIWEELLNHKERIERLEAECNRLNTNINSLQTILEALQTNDYVTDIVKIMEDGVEVGYSITFAKGGTVTIYHGTNGSAPKVGIQKASDGQYYWTADGEWLTNEEGDKIPAAVPSEDGKYITPQFRIADDIWYISFDGGNTWRQIDAVDAERDEFFQSVSSDGEYVYFVLSDDTELVIPYITTSQSFRGKVVSILGDSISTFEGWIPVEDGHNLKHRKRYPQSDLLTDVRLTWWHKLINNLGAKLGVNDSWSGSRVHNSASSNSGDLGPDACMASITRITNLGANGTPDLIFFYGGTNDAGKNVQLGTFDSSINHKVDLTATTWATFADAYAAAIMRMQYFYPDAKIIALTPMWVKSYYTVSRMNDFAEVIVSICDYFGVPVIDLRKCGINSNNIDYTLGDGLHPNAEGMDLMEKYIRRQLFAFYEGDYTENIVYKVTNNLNDAVNTDRYITGVSSGKSYTAQLTGNLSKICVKMGGTDITPSALDAESGVIYIPEVRGDILIDESSSDDVDEGASVTTWYLDHRQNSARLNSEFNTFGRGWCHIPGSAAHNAYMGKPINTIGFFTDKQSQLVTLMKIKEYGKVEDAVVVAETVVTTANYGKKTFVTVGFPEIVLTEDECLSIFSQVDGNIQAFYSTSTLTDANGIVDSGFYGRVPMVYGSGSPWEVKTSTLGLSVGYTETR